MIGGRVGQEKWAGVYDWPRNVGLLAWKAVSDSFSPMKVEKKSDGVTEIDDVLLIETQGETAQALAIRLRPVVVVDKMAGKVVTIAAAAVNDNQRPARPFITCNSRAKQCCKLQITQEC